MRGYIERRELYDKRRSFHEKTIGVFKIVLCITAVFFVLFLFGSGYYDNSLVSTIIKLLILATYPVAISGVAMMSYLELSSVKDKNRLRKVCLPYGLLAVCILLAIFPSLTHDYLFMDDLYEFFGSESVSLGVTLRYYRPMAAFTRSFYSWMQLSNSHLGRLLAVSVLILFSWVLYYWAKKTQIDRCFHS